LIATENRGFVWILNFFRECAFRDKDRRGGRLSRL
jgi:hypothetical protein